jgi:hypothetical protein
MAQFLLEGLRKGPTYLKTQQIPRLSPPIEIYMTSKRFSHKHNLPASVSSFIGREQELMEIWLRLHEHRLVTLTGTGGTGKTRLALQVAVAELDQLPDGVWLVDLAPLTAPELLPETIAKAVAPKANEGIMNAPSPCSEMRCDYGSN